MTQLNQVAHETNPETLDFYLGKLTELSERLPLYGETDDLDYSASSELLAVNALVTYAPQATESRQFLSLLRTDGRWGNLAGFAMGSSASKLVHPLDVVLDEATEELGVEADKVKHLTLGGMETVAIPGDRKLHIAKAFVQLTGRIDPVLDLRENTEFEWVSADDFSQKNPIVPIVHSTLADFA